MEFLSERCVKLTVLMSAVSKKFQSNWNRKLYNLYYHV